jgi:hypothetical protein
MTWLFINTDRETSADRCYNAINWLINCFKTRFPWYNLRHGTSGVVRNESVTRHLIGPCYFLDAHTVHCCAQTFSTSPCLSVFGKFNLFAKLRTLNQFFWWITDVHGFILSQNTCTTSIHIGFIQTMGFISPISQWELWHKIDDFDFHIWDGGGAQLGA